MASDDEDVDLEVLRSAVLASLKPKPKPSSSVNGTLSKPDEEDLQALRCAALSSKRESQIQRCHSRGSYPIMVSSKSQYLNHRNLNHRNKIVNWGRNTNLIQIQTVPLENPIEDRQSKDHSFLPQIVNKRLREGEETSMSPTIKSKSSGKFSRFESDSDSDDDSDDDLLRSFLNSEDNTETSWSFTEDRPTTESLLQPPDPEVQNVTSDSCLSSDKENENFSDCDMKEPDSHSRDLQRTLSTSGDANSCDREGSISETEGATETSSEPEKDATRKLKPASPSTELPDILLNKNVVEHIVLVKPEEKEDEAMPLQKNGGTTSGAHQEQHETTGEELNTVVQDRFEARKKKFESPYPINPNNVKISLRSIVSSQIGHSSDEFNPVHRSTKDPVVVLSVNDQQSHCFNVSNQKLVDIVTNETQIHSVNTASGIFPNTKLNTAQVEKDTSDKQAIHCDPTIDLRECLKLRRQRKLHLKAEDRSSSSSSSDESSSSGCNKIPALKSVLGVVKSEVIEKDCDRKEKSDHYSRSQNNFIAVKNHCKNSVHSKIVRKQMLQSKSRNNIGKKELQDNEDHFAHHNVSQKVRKQEISPNRLPVRMRLGLPVGGESVSKTSEKQRSNSSSPLSKCSNKRQQRHKLSRIERCHPEKRPHSRKRVKVNHDECNVIPNKIPTPSERNAGNSEFEHPCELDAKIRRIQEKNAAIKQRHEEVDADRKKYC